MHDLAAFEDSPHFTEHEKLALRLAVQLTLTPADVGDRLYEELRRRFSERELVELTAAIAWENFRARFNRTFNVQAEGFSGGDFCALPEGLSGTRSRALSLDAGVSARDSGP